MAEAIFNQLVKERGLQNYLVADSAGTAGYHIGQQPDRRTLEVLKDNGIETPHLGRKISAADFTDFQHIAVMDEANFEDVHTLYYATFHQPTPAKKLFLIRDYDPTVRGIQEVPDPYYENKKAFEKVYEMLHRSCNSLIDFLVEEYHIEIDDNQSS